MKLKEVFEKSVQFFKDKKIESARLDAELLLAHALKLDRLQIYLKYEQPLSESEVQACRDVVRRRSAGEPVAYILGERGFYGQVFKVGEGVLIPRPETELIVEESLKHLANQSPPENFNILDLGAGTGCIGFSILKEVPQAKLTAIEKSDKALPFLQQNRTLLGLEDRAEIQHADAYDYSTNEKFDVIVANPPYIAVHDAATEANVKKYEPASALFAEQNGLADIYGWVKKYAANLRPAGLFLVEIGHQQGPEVLKFAQQIKEFAKVEILKDLSGLDRVLKATHNS